MRFVPWILICGSSFFCCSALNLTLLHFVVQVAIVCSLLVFKLSLFVCFQVASVCLSFKLIKLNLYRLCVVTTLVPEVSSVMVSFVIGLENPNYCACGDKINLIFKCS